MMRTRLSDAGRFWQCVALWPAKSGFPTGFIPMIIGRATSVANRASGAPNSSWASTAKPGRSGVGREVPPLRWGNQNGCNSVMPTSCQPGQLHPELVEGLIQNLSGLVRSFTSCPAIKNLLRLCAHVSRRDALHGRDRRGPLFTRVWGSTVKGQGRPSTPCSGPRPPGHGRQDIAPLADTPVHFSPRLFFQVPTVAPGAAPKGHHRPQLRPRQGLRRLFLSLRHRCL